MTAEIIVLPTKAVQTPPRKRPSGKSGTDDRWDRAKFIIELAVASGITIEFLATVARAERL